MESTGLDASRGQLVGSKELLGSLSSELSAVQYQPPKYIIDLSSPPAQRYQHVARDFKEEIASLSGLFDEVVHASIPQISVKRIKGLARVLLRTVYSREEMEELRGIQQVTGTETFLLVAFNVLLDLFMGCTSGGVRTKEDDSEIKMLHFRTLDWGMDALRKLVVHLEFVNSPNGDVVASTITYVGFVGALTGVRKGLSLSLNFRPTHNTNYYFPNLRFYSHHLFVLLGLRPSVSSILRQCLLPSRDKSAQDRSACGLAKIESELPNETSTAAYLVFSDGDRTVVMEKDLHTAVVRSANDFIVAGNHDAAEDLPDRSPPPNTEAATLKMMGMDDLVEGSIARIKCANSLWQKATSRKRTPSSRRSTASNETFVTYNTVVKWLTGNNIANEETHYASIMDPKAGTIRWIERYLTVKVAG